MNKNLLIIPFLLLLIHTTFAFNSTFYVSNGGGINPQCQATEYSTIQSAVSYIMANSVSSATINVCEGTYTENVMLMGVSGVSIFGENNNVILKSPAVGVGPILVALSKNIYLKNLKIDQANLEGITIGDSNNIILEDITITNIKGTVIDDFNLSGIHIEDCDNVTLKGDILIENIDKSIKFTNGIEINNSTNISFDTDSLIINNIKSSNNSSDSLLTGIKVNNSDLEINSEIIITKISGRKNTTGFLIENNSVVTNPSAVDLGVTFSNSGTIIKGLEVKGGSTINLDLSTHFFLFNIGNFLSDAYAIYITDADLCMLGDLEISRILGNNKTYGLYLENSENLNISKIEISNTVTENLVRLINITNSEGVINEILIGNEDLTLSSTNFRTVDIINSYINIRKMSTELVTNLPNCICVEQDSTVSLNDFNPEGCGGNYITNQNSKISITKSPSLNLMKIQYLGPANSTTKVYKEITANFFKAGRDLELENAYIISNDFFESLYNLSDSAILDILYYTGGYKNGILDSTINTNYEIIGLTSRINEKPTMFTLNNLTNQTFDLEFFDLPDTFIEQTAKIANNIHVSDHFYVDSKICSSTLDKSFGCYDIKLSKTLEDSDNESYTLKFKVPVSWLSNNDLAKEDVILYHLEDGSYVSQKTTPQNVVNDYQVFVSEIDSFSEFQIAGKELNNENLVDPNPKTPPNPSPGQNNPEPIAPLDLNDDSNLINPNCNITCLDSQILDYINCVCLENQKVCDLTCNFEGEYLDIENCECVLSERTCRGGACDVGYSMDLNTCICMPVVLDGLPISQTNNFWWTIFRIVILVIAVIVTIVILKIRKSKTKKAIKKKKK